MEVGWGEEMRRTEGTMGGGRVGDGYGMTTGE